MPRMFLLLTSCLIATSACGYDSNGPYNSGDTTNVAGAYRATIVTSTTDTVVSDLTALGLRIDLSLASTGEMSGLLAIANGNNPPVNSLKITGRWTQVDSLLTITDDHDTFVSHLRFLVQPGRLEGIGMVEQATIRVELERLAA